MQNINDVHLPPNKRTYGGKRQRKMSVLRGKQRNTGQPARILICGNTRLLDMNAVKMIAGYYKLVICGELSFAENTSERIPRNVHLYRDDPTAEAFSRIMASHTPDTVWYLSGYADDGDGLDQENKIIRKLTEECGVHECAKLIVVSSVNSVYALRNEGKNREFFGESLVSPKAFFCAQMEDLAVYCAGKNQLKTVVVRLPRLSQTDNRATWLGGQMEKLKDGKKIVLPGKEEETADFLSTRNMTELLISITEETLDDSAMYTVVSGFGHTWGEVGQALAACGEGSVQVDYAPEEGMRDETLLSLSAQDVRKNYGFVATDDIVETLPEVYALYLEKHKKKEGLLTRLRNRLHASPDWLLKGLEVALLLLVVQGLLPLTSDTVYFRYVDLRLFYVVILGCTHGMGTGLAAGVLACVSLFFSYQDTGITGIMLFYNVEFWLPFAVYLMTGAITGYMKTTKDQKLKYSEEEIIALQNKYLFLNEVYKSVIENKKEYKRQILGYKDSFGKIFEAVQNLDSTLPSDIFMHGVETMERILENNSIAIYTLDDWQRFGRLAACSSSLATKNLSKSLSIENCKPVYDTVLAGNTWKNTDLLSDMPAYAWGVIEEGKVRVLICIYEAGAEQMSLYYVNLFTILCNLIRVSFIRALEYQDAIHDEKYYPGTDVLKYEYFRKELEIQQHMTATGVASFLLVRLEIGSIQEVDDKMRSIIRKTDFLGTDQDGNFYLLLTQVTQDTFRFVEERLKKKEIGYSVVEDI